LLTNVYPLGLENPLYRKISEVPLLRQSFTLYTNVIIAIPFVDNVLELPAYASIYLSAKNYGCMVIITPDTGPGDVEREIEEEAEAQEDLHGLKDYSRLSMEAMWVHEA
jgi:hypothetical protein